MARSGGWRRTEGRQGKERVSVDVPRIAALGLQPAEVFGGRVGVAAALPGDPDGSELHLRIKAVGREIHQLHALLRFVPLGGAGLPDYVAWFEPEHEVLDVACGHFAERMGRHSWLIATSRDGVWYDGERFDYRAEAPDEWQTLARTPDPEGQALWLAYYRSTFNPTRVNPQALRQHLPQRLWQ